MTTEAEQPNNEEPTGKPDDVKLDSYTIELDGEPMVWTKVSASLIAERSGVEMFVRSGAFFVSDRDSDHFVPPEFVGNPILPNYYCRAWNPKEGRQKYCRSRAGARTEHSGAGRCWVHGGKSLAAHGQGRRYFLKTESIQELLDAQDEDDDPLDITDEIRLTRAYFQEWLDKNPEPTPDVLLRFVNSISTMAERVTTMRAKHSFTSEEIRRFLFSVDRVHEMRLKEHPQLLASIREDIHGIQIG